MSSPYSPLHPAPHQRRPIYAHHTVPYAGPYINHRHFTPSGYPYPPSPPSPTRQSEAPLTSGEIELYTRSLPYVCSCGRSFRGRAQIGAHIQQHPGHRDCNPGRNLFECPRKCGRMIDDMEDLADHLERRHFMMQDIRGLLAPFVSKYICCYTRVLGLTAANLAYHRSQFSPTPVPDFPYPLSCPSPSPTVITTSTSTTDSDTGLWGATGSTLTHDSKPYACRCGKTYKRRVDLETHIQSPVRNHFDTTVYRFNCLYCDRKHPTQEGMQKHMEGAHGMKYNFDDIQTISSAIEALSLPSPLPDTPIETPDIPIPTSAPTTTINDTPHVVDITTGLKPLPPYLIQFYSKLEPFKCKCGAGFTTFAYLNTHVERYKKKLGEARTHVDVTGPNRYLHPCLLCNEFSFPTPKQLKAHLNDHHNTESSSEGGPMTTLVVPASATREKGIHVPARSNSPIAYIPTDILTTIFFLCLGEAMEDTIDGRLPREDLSIISPKHPTILLSHVCKTWRDTALGTPRLWASLSLTLPGFNSSLTDEDCEETFDQWTRRSTRLIDAFALYNTVRAPAEVHQFLSQLADIIRALFHEMGGGGGGHKPNDHINPPTLNLQNQVLLLPLPLLPFPFLPFIFSSLLRVCVYCSRIPPGTRSAGSMTNVPWIHDALPPALTFPASSSFGTAIEAL
ncbi:hypothetical protein NMY22_g18493 [Coprinellus aureogranulatus]|nr:hypothetical protein NMY22_g18493 [Coprinellus aureogranulatus]